MALPTTPTENQKINEQQIEKGGEKQDASNFLYGQARTGEPII